MPDLDALLKKADLCVMCGQCLPYCPTYALERNETESPRGRMSLIMALQRGDVGPEADLLGHLDSCLLCRACERVCPSKVPFAAVMVAGRARFGTTIAPAGRLERWATEAARQGSFGRLLRLYQHSGLQSLVRQGNLLGHGRLARLDSLLPGAIQRTRHQPPAKPSASRGAVNLFTGCTGDTLDTATVAAATAVLERYGYTVQRPAAPLCCGALDLHEGRIEDAEQLARRNIETLAGDAPVISIASGCAAALADYGTWYGEAGAQFAARVVEIDVFLADAPLPATTPAALNEAVAVHVPCSQRNGLRRAGASEQLLRLIPGISLHPLAEGCCGGSGRNMLEHPEQADHLAAPFLDQIKAIGARTVVSSNIGCALHLAGAARRQGWELEVIHPLVLLQRQFEQADAGTDALAPPRSQG